MSVFAAKSVYSAHILPTILYCSTPVLKISDTMAQKFENSRKRHVKSFATKQMKVERTYSAVS